jgi:hypothetical protein
MKNDDQLAREAGGWRPAERKCCSLRLADQATADVCPNYLDSELPPIKWGQSQCPVAALQAAGGVTRAMPEARIVVNLS